MVGEGATGRGGSLKVEGVPTPLELSVILTLTKNKASLYYMMGFADV